MRGRLRNRRLHLTCSHSLSLMSLREQDILVGHEDRVWCVAWHPDGQTLATCGGDKTIRFWGRDGS